MTRDGKREGGRQTGVGKQALNVELPTTAGAGVPGRRTLSETLPVQRIARGSDGGSSERAPTACSPAEIARTGIAGGGRPLPHLARIQASFGHHDVSRVQAHQGGATRDAAQALGARAYAMGNSVAFDDTPDLHTAAHEAAHVVQQRGGVQLKGGIDQPGDAYERHADAVADAVVAGQSAAPLLDQMAGAGAGNGDAQAVQRAPLTPSTATEDTANNVDSSRGKRGTFVHNAAAGFRATYHIDGDDVLVFIPDGGITPPTVNIFMFFHGKAANYAGEEVNTLKYSDPPTNKHLIENVGDNAAKATKFGEAVTAAGGHNVIGICPLQSAANWGKRGAGSYTTLVHEVLKNIGGAIGVKDLAAGKISLAGHSGGGQALGGAATDLNDKVSDITLQDAGYGYGGGYPDSFRKTRDWLLTGAYGKTLRLIAHTTPLTEDKAGTAKPETGNTRYILAKDDGFNQKSFEDRIAELTRSHDITAPLTVTVAEFPIDWALQKDGEHVPHLEATVTINGPSGVKGRLQVFGIKTGHFEVRNDTMAPLIANGASGDPMIFGNPKPPPPHKSR